jgi:Ca2+-binding RTX toxin-like protein
MTLVPYNVEIIEIGLQLKWPLNRVLLPISRIHIQGGGGGGTMAHFSRHFARSASVSVAIEEFSASLLPPARDSDPGTPIPSLEDLPHGVIGGVVFHDLDGDGYRDEDEGVLEGRTVILDDDGNGIVDAGEITALTDEFGQFTFYVRPGIHSVTEVLPDGWRGTGRVGPLQLLVPFGERAEVSLSSVDISTITGGISGTLFHDQNNDGIRDSSDLSMAGWTIFLDANRNHRLDPGEPFTITDSDGRYHFEQLAPGNYSVTAQTSQGWEAWKSRPEGMTVMGGTMIVDQDIAISGGTTALDDVIHGGRSGDIIDGQSGDDLLIGRGGQDQLTGGAGGDRLLGGTGDDILGGGSGNDEMFGGAGKDVLRGGQSDDRLQGGLGDDVLNGGRGDDLMVGGRGSDSFVFVGATGEDQILDFRSTKGDLIWIDAESVTDFASLTISRVERGALVTWAEGSVLLRGVAPGDLTDAHFRFEPFPEEPPVGDEDSGGLDTLGAVSSMVLSFTSSDWV